MLKRRCNHFERLQFPFEMNSYSANKCFLAASLLADDIVTLR